MCLDIFGILGIMETRVTITVCSVCSEYPFFGEYNYALQNDIYIYTYQCNLIANFPEYLSMCKTP